MMPFGLSCSPALAIASVWARSRDSPAAPGAFCRLRSSGSVASISKPVIAAVNGDSIDQGLELALACDLRIASSGARFGLTHITRGLVPWDGGTQRLPRLIGLGRATGFVLTGRLVDAGEAHRIGLVNETVNPGETVERALVLASLLASHGPAAQRYAKEAVLAGTGPHAGPGPATRGRPELPAPRHRRPRRRHRLVSRAPPAGVQG